MSLYEDWKQMAEIPQTPEQQNAFWKEYYALEKKVYEKILQNKDTVIEGTFRELAVEFEMEDTVFVGFIDGINSSLKKEYTIEKLKPEPKIRLDVDFEMLYYNMLEAKAKWLYELKEWDDVLSEEKRNGVRKEWRASKQAVSEKTVGRNDPCPCGSGQKYKKCCGK